MQGITHTFDYELMNTSLQIVLPNVDEQYAKSASYDCYCRLENMENLISMYKYGSDISMLNSEKIGGIVKISDCTYNCLMTAFNASVISKGAIDVCMGEFFLKAKNDTYFPKIEKPRRGKFAFDAENYLVQKLEDGMIDLGAIGKGFALETVQEILVDEWQIKNAFISFGASSIYAVGSDQNGDTWHINLSDKILLPLNNSYVGASGTSVLGEHIIDCRTGEIPKEMPFRTWAFSKSGAMSDAMSTAFMILPREDIAEICNQYEISGAIQQTQDSEIEFFGTR